MIVAGSASPLLLSSAGGYNLTNSLRFRSSASAYLNRTPASAGNQQKFTWSGWLKRGVLGGSNILLSAYSSGSASQTNDFEFRFNSDSLDINYSNGTWITTTPVYRDPSAWYHIVLAVDTTQATAANRFILYVNNQQITAFSTASYPAQNTNLIVNTTNSHYIGRAATAATWYLDGYLAEINFIDGQALTPSSFGQTSATTGVWIPKKYTGTYGTNGFYLPFTDNSALTTSSNAGLGKDFSGNSNYWTTNNISITSGSTYDSMTDVPTLTSATAANYAVWNPLRLDSTSTLSNGNLTVTKTAGGGYGLTTGTFAIPTSGKWYWEVTITAFDYGVAVGVTNTNDSTSTYIEDGTYSCGYYSTNGNIYYSTGNSAYGNTYTVGDIIGVAVDMDNGAIYFAKNNTYQNSGVPTSGASKTGAARTNLSGANIYPSIGGFTSQTHTLNINCGQRPFSYTPPSGFVALNTFNLPTPTIGATATTTANKYFGINLWTGNGSTGSRAITGLGFKPDWVWWKNRTTAKWHQVFDSNRGADKALSTNATDAEDASGGYGGEGSVTSFDTDGYTLQGGVGNNENNSAIVGWAWQAGQGTNVTNTAGSITSTVSANTSAGFSIVTYTGTGSAGTVGHGLGVAPSMVIIKSRTTGSSSWIVYHSSISPTNLLTLQTTDAQQNLPLYFNSTATASTVFSIGSAANTGIDLNVNGSNYVAYCFAPVAGYSAFGSYTGNGSTDGPFVFCGFRPRFIMFKNASSAGTVWIIFDTARNTYNFADSQLRPNASDAENSAGASFSFDILSNGFKVRSSDSNFNGSGNTMIYAAFAESPFKYANAR